MEFKKVFLEQLFEEIRTLSETFETEEGEKDVFVLNTNELNAFSEELLKVVKNFSKNEILPEDIVFEEVDEEEEDELLFMDFYDEDDLD